MDGSRIVHMAATVAVLVNYDCKSDPTTLVI